MATMAAPPAERGPVFDFDYMRDEHVLADVHKGYWRLKEEAPPIFWTPRNEGHWVVTTAKGVTQVTRHPELFSSKYLSIPVNPNQPRMIPENLDPPEHRPYRQLLRPYFETKAIAPRAPRITEWCEELLDAVVPAGKCEFVDELGSRFPVFVFMELFGLPLDRFDECRNLVVSYFNSRASIETRMELGQQILALLAQTIELRRAEPGEDLISELISIDFQNRKLDQEELMSICFLMFLAGLDTVVNALTFGMRHLAHDEALRQRIIDDPDCIPAVVEELMRRYSFVATPRLVVEDTELDGVELKAGESVLAPLMFVGWDESLTECPADVSIDRPACRHAGFGSGIHTCLGIHLARMEMQIFYKLWFEKIGHFREVEGVEPPVFRGGSVMALENLHLAWGD